MSLSVKQMLMVNVLTTLCVVQGIAFDLAYTAGNRREAAAAQFTIHLSPVLTMTYSI